MHSSTSVASAGSAHLEPCGSFGLEQREPLAPPPGLVFALRCARLWGTRGRKNTTRLRIIALRVAIIALTAKVRIIALRIRIIAVRLQIIPVRLRMIMIRV